MPDYLYKARDESGKLVKGALDADSADEVSAKLRKMGYMAVSLSLAKKEIDLEGMLRQLRRINPQDLIVFNFQLANLLESGISLLIALRTIEAQTANKRLKDVLGELWRAVESGSSFSESLSRHPKVFSKLFVNMVKAGEESGKLDAVLKKYASFSEAKEELSQKIKGALFYPLILFIASILVIVFIVTFIMPKFADLFLSAGLKLPLVTQILFSFGVIIKRYWYLIILGFCILSWLIVQYARTKTGKFQFDRLVLKIPAVGDLARKIYVSRFSRTLAVLLSSGVSVLRSLDITKEVIGNEVMAGVMANLKASVEQGERLSEPLRVSGEFPLDAVQMISAGEESGNLDGMLDKIADFYDTAVGYSLKKLTALIEPLLLAIMGAVVAVIMASVLIPIFDMVKIIRH
ncbi:MAG: type II secretion system F family protein [Candidatus Omnitrophota bacterium]|nr:type II secretion system F family protein [Candidatus Omnitrophota bacterium]